MWSARFTRRWPLLGLAATLTLIAGGLGIAYAAGVIPAVDGTIYACYSDQHVRLVGPAESCKERETPIYWNQEGLPGADGEAGARGPQGLPGADGEAGAQGPQGFPGADGADGALGLKGLPGADGAQGPQGLPGADGAQGPQGLPGANGAQGPQGLPGANGADGAQGSQGPPGAGGSDGARGPQGRPGISGEDGARGPQGRPGLDGEDGARGPQGRPGIDGEDGARGPQGLRGIPGSNARVIHTVDNRPGCPGALPSNVPILTQNFVLTASTPVYVTADIIRLASGRRDLNLYVDGRVSDRTLTFTSGVQWADAHLSWSGVLSGGSHTLTVSSPHANVWGCGPQWGSIDTILFDPRLSGAVSASKD